MARWNSAIKSRSECCTKVFPLFEKDWWKADVAKNFKPDFPSSCGYLEKILLTFVGRSKSVRFGEKVEMDALPA